MPGCLSIGEHPADLGDVALAAAAGVGVEPELDRHARRRQQGELLGDVGFIHVLIMNEGCFRVPTIAASRQIEPIETADTTTLSAITATGAAYPAQFGRFRCRGAITANAQRAPAAAPPR